jgi:hypothetical protein
LAGSILLLFLVMLNYLDIRLYFEIQWHCFGLASVLNKVEQVLLDCAQAEFWIQYYNASLFVWKVCYKGQVYEINSPWRILHLLSLLIGWRPNHILADAIVIENVFRDFANLGTA